MRRPITKSLIPTSIAQEISHLVPLQVGFKARLYAIFLDTRDAFAKLGEDSTYIGVSVDALNAFNNTSQIKMLRQAAAYAPSLILFTNAVYTKDQPYLRFGDGWLRSQKGSQQRGPDRSPMFVRANHTIVQCIEFECDFVLHRWYADVGIIVGKIDQVKLSLDVITEQVAAIKFILNPSKTKAYWSNKNPLLLSLLSNSYELDLRQTSDGAKVLNVPFGSQTFVFNFIRNIMDAVGKAHALAVMIRDGRIAHNTHRVTASACSMTHLIRLIPTADVMTQLLVFEDRQSSRFERICNITRPAAARHQARLPRALVDHRLYGTKNISPFVYV